MERMIGSIEAGKRADLIVVDRRRPSDAALMVSHPSTCPRRRRQGTIVNGRWMRDRKVCTLDARR